MGAKERWIVNASPIITLAKIDHITLLDALPRSLVIPTAVVQEVRE